MGLKPLSHLLQRLHSSWNLLQVSLVLLPFSPFLGTLGMVGVMVQMWSRHPVILLRKPSVQGLGILGLWLIATASVALHPGEAFLGLVHFLPLFGLFASLSLLLQSSAQLRRLAWLMTLTAIPILVTGLGQQFWGWAGHPRILWIVFNPQIYPTGNPPGRMASVFEYATVLANYLVIILPLVVGLWINAYPRAAQFSERTRRVQDWWLWIGLSALLVSIGVCILFTHSRNAWGISIVEIFLFGLYQGWHLLTVSVSAVAGAVGGAAFGIPPLNQWLRLVVPRFLWARLTDELYPNRPWAELRTTQWQFAWNLTQQRPWTGWGLRNFPILYQAQMDFPIGHPHNLFLMLSAETGLPATLLLVGLVGWVVYQGVKFLIQQAPQQWSAADRVLFVSYLLAFLGSTLFSCFDVPLFDARINILGWLILGAIAGPVSSQTQSQKQHNPD